MLVSKGVSSWLLRLKLENCRKDMLLESTTFLGTNWIEDWLVDLRRNYNEFSVLDSQVMAC
jgi:hypothetical protein